MAKKKTPKTTQKSAGGAARRAQRPAQKIAKSPKTVKSAKTAKRDKDRRVVQVSESLWSQAKRVARETHANALLVYLDAAAEEQRFPQPPDDLFYVTRNEELAQELTDDGRRVITLPYVGLTRFGQIKLATLLALTRGLLEPEDRIVCLSGLPENAKLDTLAVLDVGRELSLSSGSAASNHADMAESDVSAEALERVIDVATELGAEGREGMPVGTIFVVGDIEHVLPHTRQLVLNPFQGYKREQRNLLDARLEETIKEFSTIDGAFLIDGNGTIEAAGVYLKTADLPTQELPHGLGARHQAAAGITAVTGAIAISISQSTGTVTVFRGGRMVTEIEKPRRLGARKGRREGGDE